jgi:hypothetical protein
LRFFERKLIHITYQNAVFMQEQDFLPTPAGSAIFGSGEGDIKQGISNVGGFLALMPVA